MADLEKHTSVPRRKLQYSLKSLVEMEFLQRLGKGAGSRYQLVFEKCHFAVKKTSATAKVKSRLDLCLGRIKRRGLNG